MVVGAIVRPSLSQAFAPPEPPTRGALSRRLSSVTAPRRSLLQAQRRRLEVLGQEYPSDDYSNLPSSILSRLAHGRCSRTRPHTRSRSFVTRLNHTFRAPLQFEHPLDSQHRAQLWQAWLPRRPSRTITYGHLLPEPDHLSAHPHVGPRGRRLCRGHDRWLLTADVYRRDEIDATHYPIFHQMEGACVLGLDAYEPGGQVERECEEMEAHLERAAIEIEDGVDVQEAGGWQAEHESDPAKLNAAKLSMRHLKATLNGLVLELFGARHAAEAASSPLRVRWISATFPFTSPSFEVEVLFRGKWLEILGCGVVKDRTLIEAKRPDRLGWAFGLGLERIAMVLYSIPDIRLFWSKDPRFLSQFSSAAEEPQTSKAEASVALEAGVSAAGGSVHARPKLVTFRPYSKFPPCYKDVSFWLPSAPAPEGDKATFHENDLMEIVRDVASDLVEDVGLIDEFVHPKTNRRSKCYRINYRSMDR
ncbi:hypothetical protein L7F22_057031 [Adiantum nelumboides]|nr:hypothetical protein [Adiantum nelumboides]